MARGKVAGQFPLLNPLVVGQKILDFPVLDTRGEATTFHSMRGHNTLIVFVPLSGHPQPRLSPAAVALGKKLQGYDMSTIQISVHEDSYLLEDAGVTVCQLLDSGVISLSDPARTAWEACHKPRLNTIVLVGVEGEVMQVTPLEDCRIISSSAIL